VEEVGCKKIFDGKPAMQVIRIPQERWGEVWGALIASGPITRVSQEPIYVVSDRQIRLLRRKKLPFEVVGPAHSYFKDETSGKSRTSL
jgi:hypothetical protein